VCGEDDLLRYVKKVFASLYNDRAIAYRVHHGFAHADVALSAGVQRMVRSDIACSGVLFTLDTESGFRDVVSLPPPMAWAKPWCRDRSNPDEFYVHKPMLVQGFPAVVRPRAGWKSHPHGVARRRDGDREHAACAAAAVCADRQRGARTVAPGGRDRNALWPPDGRRVGEGRRNRRTLHRAGASGDRYGARQRRHRALRPEGDRHGAHQRPRHRPENRWPARCA